MAGDGGGLPDVIDLTRDTHPWLEDGNIVLVAGTTAFRVYKGLLAAQSSVFADMFLASSPRADEVFEGCPVVRLSDSPEDLRHLLHILVPNMRQRVYFSDKEELYTFRQLSSLVRLAHKYCIVDVEQQALACLKKYFTDKFDLWDNTPGLFVYGHEQHDLSSGIEAIRLARLTNTPEMLPVAFYICTLLEGAVLDGWTRADGTVVHLASEDLRRVIDGYGILQRESHQLLTDQVSVKPHKTCVTPAQCGPMLQYLLEKHLENKSPWVLHAFPAYIAYVANK